ncbi:response regulator [bacterium]|nr:response regulator [bacterium]QQR57948.1 MAG: response regulator [Candidatus Melainabacteria bacterium]
MKSWQDTFDNLKAKYIKRSTDRLTEILELLDGIHKNPQDKELMRKLSRNFHWMAGSGTMYGFEQVSVLGVEAERYCETMLASDRTIDVTTIEKLRTLVSELSTVFFTSGESNRDTQNLDTTDGGTSVPLSGAPEEVAQVETALLIDEDGSTFKSLVQNFDDWGLTVKNVKTLNQAMQEILKQMPTVINLAVPVPDGNGYEFVEQVRSMPGGDEPCIIIASKQAGFIDKVRAMHCGADSYYEKPLDYKSVTRRIKYLLDRKKMSPAKILSVEDDPDQAAFIRAFLESAGYQVKTCTDPRQFEQAMSQFQPDLVLLDVMLSGMTGFELARYIRQDERYATLPIVFLTTQNQLDARIESARAGGDDHLIKPVAPALLLNCVASRLERSRYLRSLLYRDGLTALLNHTAFMEQMSQVYSNQKRKNGEAVIIVIDLDNLKAINERHGFPGGDKVIQAVSLMLRKRLRQSDIIGRIQSDEFGIVAEGISEKEAVLLAGRLIDDFSQMQHSTLSYSGFYATCSAGVAKFDPSSMTLEKWVGAAYSSLAEAKAQGRNCVVGYGESKSMQVSK